MTDTPEGGHLDLDTLAELDEGLVDASAEPAMRAHLDECARCRDDLARLRTTRALVSTLPADPMPPEVAARIDRALADAADAPGGATTVVPLGRRRRWRNGPTLAGLAAAAAVVLLVGALIAGRVSHTSDKSSGAASAPTLNGGSGAAGAGPLKEWRTGNDYTPASLATLVPKLVTGTPPPETGGSGASDGLSAGGGANSAVPAPRSPAPQSPPPSHSTATTPSATEQKSVATPAGGTLDYSALAASQAAVLQCARILNGGPPVTPVAVDFARFKGEPAVIFVLPTVGHPQSLDVWVVRTVCSTSSFDLYFNRIPRPAS